MANLLLCKAGGFGGSGAAIAAAGAELGRSAARTFLAPLLETACDRLAHVIRALFDLAADMVKHSAQGETKQRWGPPALCEGYPLDFLQEEVCIRSFGRDALRILSPLAPLVASSCERFHMLLISLRCVMKLP